MPIYIRVELTPPSEAIRIAQEIAAWLATQDILVQPAAIGEMGDRTYVFPPDKANGMVIAQAASDMALHYPTRTVEVRQGPRVLALGTNPDENLARLQPLLARGQDIIVQLR